MRACLTAVAATIALAGCGDAPLPDEATSRLLVEQVVLDWHRFQADGNGESGCRLLTGERQDAMAELHREIAASIEGDPVPEDCTAAVATYASFPDSARQMLRDTRVDTVRLDGERATATAHTTVVLRGVERQTPPVELPLVWSDGRWLID